MTAGPLAVDADEYRALMSAFPTGVAVVTSIDEELEPRGATCSSLCSVTLTPPTLLVCLTTRSSTLGAIRHCGRFAVNLLHSRARETAEIFSTPVDDRFGTVPWKQLGSAGVPWLIRDAFAVAECRVTRLTAVGSHTMVLGNVASTRSSPNVPLLYGLRQFSRWTPEETC
ncbi:flavin reductase family protein [Streptomyces sp. N2-109]|uniref:Flavin reductase family protein n=1 Tax=Streptomyces gossypii TaxID=2883101 RepID=A0ABT2JZ38_9ACTN|nr:flavin reductase family protein [Streptomyces gossypii]MCT2593174.1 flavin reductase family protein [Streptomyces gossypii]